MHEPKMCRGHLSAASAALAVLCSLSAPASAQADMPRYACQVLSSERVDLASPVAGIIDAILVDRGSRVSAGEPVAMLRADIERAVVSLAEARASAQSLLRARESQFAFLDRKLKRNRELSRRNIVSENDIDQIQTERDVAEHDATAAGESLKVAQMELAKARAELAIRTVRSPIDGVVTARKLSPGDLVSDKAIVVIEKINPLYIETALPVALLGSVRIGDMAAVSFDAPGVKPRSVPVSLIDPVVEPTSNTFGVRLIVDNADNGVPAGVKCRVQFAR